MRAIREADAELGAFCRYMFHKFLEAPSSEMFWSSDDEISYFHTIMSAAAYIENDETYNYDAMVHPLCYERFDAFADNIDDIDARLFDDDEQDNEIDTE